LKENYTEKRYIGKIQGDKKFRDRLTKGREEGILKDNMRNGWYRV